MGLSKGTLGLKFMNRQAPAQPPSASAAASTAAGASPASSTAASKSTPAPAQPASAGKASTQAKNESKATSTGKREAGKEAAGQSSRPVAAPTAEWNKPSKSTAGSGPAVVHENSLLAFPLLSGLKTPSSSRSAAPTDHHMAMAFSSMPLTSAAVSGRRSFGGANIEIEKLNDPSSHREPVAGEEGKGSSSRRAKRADRDAAPVGSVRRGANKGSSLLSGQTQASKRSLDRDRAQDERRRPARDQDEDGSGATSGAGQERKKRRKTDENGVAPRWNVDDDEMSFSGSPATSRRDDRAPHSAKTGQAQKATPLAGSGFARPGGFEDVKKTKGSARADARQSGSGLGKEEEGYWWAQRGETRDWDEGKEEEDEEDTTSDEDEEDDSDSDSDSEEEEEEAMVSSDEDDSEDDDVRDEERKFADAADRTAVAGGQRASRGKGRRR
ncbi:hypothetical protein JCM8202_004486 [Rhodotorula sphaerocarpa]